MQIWAESGKSALPICNYSQILYQFLTFTQNLKRSLENSISGSYSVVSVQPLCSLQSYFHHRRKCIINAFANSLIFSSEGSVLSESIVLNI